MFKFNLNLNQKLLDKYKSINLTLLFFPSNSYGQEYSDNDQIREFIRGKLGDCADSQNYHIFELSNVYGSKKNPVFEYLTNALKGTFFNAPKWNFTKFLIDPQGTPIKRLAPNDLPSNFEKDLDKFLSEEN